MLFSLKRAYSLCKKYIGSMNQNMVQTMVISTLIPFIKGKNNYLTNQNPSAFAAGQGSERNAWA